MYIGTQAHTHDGLEKNFQLVKFFSPQHIFVGLCKHLQKPLDFSGAAKHFMACFWADCLPFFLATLIRNLRKIYELHNSAKSAIKLFGKSPLIDRLTKNSARLSRGEWRAEAKKRGQKFYGQLWQKCHKCFKALST